MVRGGGQAYKFIADCNAKYCSEIRKYMKTQGFIVRIKDTWTGDHYGIKRFETKNEAIKEADRLFKRYSRGKKMHRITIIPPGE